MSTEDQCVYELRKQGRNDVRREISGGQAFKLSRNFAFFLKLVIN